MKTEYLIIGGIITIILIVFYYVSIKPVIEDIDKIAELSEKINKIL